MLGPTVAVQIGEAGIAAPAVGMQAHFRGHIFEMVMTHVLVEDGMFVALGMQVAGEAIWQATYSPSGPFSSLVYLPDVADQKIEQAVIVVVEEQRLRRNARPGRRRLLCVMSLKWPCPSFLNRTLPPRTVVTNRSWSPSLSISAKAAPTLMRPGKPTPASSVMFLNLPPPSSSRVHCRRPDSRSKCRTGRRHQRPPRRYRCRGHNARP